MRALFEYQLDTAPAADPITLAEAKAACRVTHDDEDSYLALLIDGAVALLDGPTGYLGQAIVEQTWTVRCGPSGVERVLSLPFGPVSDVTAIKTHDGTALTTHDLADFRILFGKFDTTIEPISGQWPAMADRADALQITFKAGASSVAAVPATIKQAVLMQVAHWYDNRDSADLAPGLPGVLVNERRF